MSKKSKRKGRGAASAARPPVPKGSRPGGYYIVALSAIVLLAVAAAASRFDAVRRAVGLRSLTAASLAQATPTPLPLSKEYVYAGGRLVATEEPAPSATPTPPPAGPPPAALTATGYFPSSNTAAVKLVWAAPSGATPTSYVVERATTRGADGPAYAVVGAPVTTLPTQASPYVDQAPAGAVYVYRVKAFYGGGYSGYCTPDVASTVRYTGDDPLVGGNDPQHAASVVRAADLTELRAVVEAVRALAGVGVGAWKGNPAPQSQGSILKDHFQELRDNLNPALSALGITQMPPDATLGVALPVKATHVQDVRDKVR
jgi:hypothetical protein